MLMTISAPFVAGSFFGVSLFGVAGGEGGDGGGGGSTGVASTIVALMPRTCRVMISHQLIIIKSSSSHHQVLIKSSSSHIMTSLMLMSYDSRADASSKVE